MDVLAKLMDYMRSKFNTLKDNIVGLFDVYVGDILDKCPNGCNTD